MRFAIVVIFLAACLFSSGCATSRAVQTRSASDVLFDVVGSMLEMFSESEFEEFRNRSRDNFNARREWQCENLSASELNELGIRK